jgi:transcriptional regulator with XRE-family HTH domain
MIAYFAQCCYKYPVDLSAGQCRAARGLLGLTQTDLAARSGVSLRTIVNFESEQRQTIPANLAAIRRALEDAGVEFIDEDGAVGVRVKPRGRR